MGKIAGGCRRDRRARPLVAPAERPGRGVPRSLRELGREEEGRREHLASRSPSPESGTLRSAAHRDARLAAAQAAWGEWIERLRALAACRARRPRIGALGARANCRLWPKSGRCARRGGRRLSDRLRFLRREPPLRRYGCVFVGAIDEVRGRVFDVVFLPGLCEGLFPSRSLEDPILLDVYRRELHAGLRVQDDRVAAERLPPAHRLRRRTYAPGLFVPARGCSRIASARAHPSMLSKLCAPPMGGCPDLRMFEERPPAGARPRAWTGPRRSTHADAIDDAEFDLASLGRYLSVNQAPRRVGTT